MPDTKKQKKRKALKMKRKVFRASDPMFSVFMWGVHHSVSQLTHTTIPPLLLDSDFKAYSKVSPLCTSHRALHCEVFVVASSVRHIPLS